MGRKKAQPEEEPVFDPLGRWRSIQLTPEQKAALRARSEKAAEEARRNRAEQRRFAPRSCGVATRLHSPIA